MCILHTTVLNILQEVVEFNTHRTSLGAILEVFLGQRVVDATYGRDNSRSTASASLLECSELLNGNGAVLNLQAQILSQGAERHIGNRGKYRSRIGSYIGIILDTKEVSSTKLVDILLLLGVEVEAVCEASLVCARTRANRSSVVTTNLGVTRTVRSSAVVEALQSYGDRFEALLEVGTYGGYEHNKGVLVRLLNTHLCACTNQQGAQVERCTSAIGRNVLSVSLNSLSTHLLEEFEAGHLHTQVLARALHTLSVLLQAEEAHFAVNATESLHTLENLLTIVEAGSCHMDRKVLAVAYLNLAPRAIFPYAAGVVVGFNIAKTKLLPFNVFHFT